MKVSQLLECLPSVHKALCSMETWCGSAHLDPSTQEVEAISGVRGYLWLYSKFKGSFGYKKPLLKK